jgi:hypothetical protein
MALTFCVSGTINYIGFLGGKHDWKEMGIFIH